MEQRHTSPEDAQLAIKILKHALEYRPTIRPGVTGAAFLSLTKEERLNETLTPRMTLGYADEDKTIPILFFRFVGDEAPVIEAVFYPYEAILTFLDEARGFVQWAYPADTKETVKEHRVFESTVDMTLIMLDHFYQRAELMMDSFVWEVITQWRLNNTQKAVHYQAELGETVPKQKDRGLTEALSLYTKQIVDLWKWQGQSIENIQKLRLAEDYDGIYLHWKRLLGMIGDTDWREYAQVGKFADTPDDLLEKLPDVDRRDDETTRNRLSEFAVEHAARRAGILKKHGVDQSILDKRKNGVKATGYSSGYLFEFLREGREFLKRSKEREALLIQEREGVEINAAVYSAQMEKAKSLEQKVDFIQSESSKTDKPIGDSVQEENLSK